MTYIGGEDQSKFVGGSARGSVGALGVLLGGLAGLGSGPVWCPPGFLGTFFLFY